MKKYVCMLMVAAALFGFRSNAQSAAGSPSDVAVKFTKSMLSLDIKSAQNYVTAQTDSALEKIAPMLEGQKASVPDSIKTLLDNAKVVASNEKITGDSASVNITTTFDRELQGTKEKTQTLSLVKESGLWKVLLELGGM